MNSTTGPATNLTAAMFLDAAARLRAYTPRLPAGYVFGPNAEHMLRNAAICERFGYQSIFGVPYWIDSEMQGTHVECYYDRALLEERTKAIEERASALATATPPCLLCGNNFTPLNGSAPWCACRPKSWTRQPECKKGTS